MQYILATSLLSRILVLILQFIFNIIIKDHNAVAYKNTYYKTLSKNESSLNIPNTYLYLYNFVEGLTKWDSQYILDISNEGYKSEQHIAFLPLFPLSISVVTQLLFVRGGRTLTSLGRLFNVKTQTSTGLVSSTTELENYIRTAVIGCTLNNLVFFPIACIALFNLTLLVKRNDVSYARKVVWWFCFNPASIFFSACYTESLFSALTFTLMYVLEYKADTYIKAHQKSHDDEEDQFEPLSQLRRVLQICSSAVPLIALSTATRSNGLVTIGFLGYQFLLKYVNLRKVRQEQLTLMTLTTTILEFAQDVLVVVILSVIAASGYITFQIYSYLRFCVGNLRVKTEDNFMSVAKIRSEWCEHTIPHPYRHVQAKYWDVGIFQYYQIKKLPNFLLAFPVTYLILMGALKHSKITSRLIARKKQLPYYVQGVVLTLFCGLTINVEVLTRLLTSSCPVFYWICADFSQESRWKNRALKIYFVSYFLLGTALHSNFYPWT